MASENPEREERADEVRDDEAYLEQQEVDPFPETGDDGVTAVPPESAEKDDAVTFSSSEESTLEQDVAEATDSDQEPGSASTAVAAENQEPAANDLQGQLAMNTGSFWFLVSSVVVLILSIIMTAV